MKILIVEDDKILQMGLTKALAIEGYAYDSAFTAHEAQTYIDSTEYAGILLDVGLPDQNGISLLKKWRAQNITVPVLMITARDSLEDRVSGLDAGADDYLIKPFELAELFARLRAIIRRHQGQSDNTIIIEDLVLDLSHRTLKQNGQMVDLTPREFAIVSRLILKQGNVVSRELLQQDIYSWQDSFGSNTLEVYIHHLRQKIGKEWIHTVRGMGYRFGDSI